MNNSELLERFRELEARLQKVNTELDGLRVAIKGRTFTENKVEMPTKIYEVGEYVRVKPYWDTDEFVGMVTERTETPKGFVYVVYRNDLDVTSYAWVDADMIEKWEPKKGEMCIFWDENIVFNSVVRLFDSRGMSQYFDYASDLWENCIPFLSEQQYKRHIGKSVEDVISSDDALNYIFGE